MDKEVFILKMRNKSLEKRNWALKMSLRNLPKLLEQAGEVPVYHVGDLPEGLRLYSLRDCGLNAGCSVQTFYNRIKKFGLVSREGKMLVLDQSLQHRTFAVYVFGERNIYSTLQLRLTREGMDAILELTRQMMETGKTVKRAGHGGQ